MDKVTHSTKNITPFGGLNFIYDAIKRVGLHLFLDKELGSLSVGDKYKRN